MSQEQQPPDGKAQARSGVPIVALGASAGGIEALATAAAAVSFDCSGVYVETDY